MQSPDKQSVEDEQSVKDGEAERRGVFSLRIWSGIAFIRQLRFHAISILAFRTDIEIPLMQWQVKLTSWSVFWSSIFASHPSAWIIGAGMLAMKLPYICLFHLWMFLQDDPERISSRKVAHCYMSAWGVSGACCIEKTFLGGIQAFFGMNIELLLWALARVHEVSAKVEIFQSKDAT